MGQLLPLYRPDVFTRSSATGSQREMPVALSPQGSKPCTFTYQQRERSRKHSARDEHHAEDCRSSQQRCRCDCPLRHVAGPASCQQVPRTSSIGTHLRNVPAIAGILFGDVRNNDLFVTGQKSYTPLRHPARRVERHFCYEGNEPLPTTEGREARLDEDLIGNAPCFS